MSDPSHMANLFACQITAGSRSKYKTFTSYVVYVSLREFGASSSEQFQSESNTISHYVIRCRAVWPILSLAIPIFRLDDETAGSDGSFRRSLSSRVAPGASRRSFLARPRRK